MAEEQLFFNSASMQQILSWNSIIPTAVSAVAHDLIENRVQEHPEQQAVCAWDGNLSYRELDTLASRLAYHLTVQSVGPEILVPLCFEKSKWMIVSMLAVLKAGGVFVSLDPTQPQSRLRHMVQKTEAKLLLASQKYAQLCADIVSEVWWSILPLATAASKEQRTSQESRLKTPHMSYSRRKVLVNQKAA